MGHDQVQLVHSPTGVQEGVKSGSHLLQPGAIELFRESSPPVQVTTISVYITDMIEFLTPK